jgi:hypothetical protein
MRALSANEFDKRPFKGKGVDEWLARLNREYVKIVSEMEILSEQSRRAPGNNWYVYLHHRRPTDQRFLMWRSFGVKHVHLTWDRIQPMLSRMEEPERQRYAEMNDLVKLLNAKEVVTRKALRMARELV